LQKLEVEQSPLDSKRGLTKGRWSKHVPGASDKKSLLSSLKLVSQKGQPTGAVGRDVSGARKQGGASVRREATLPWDGFRPTCFIAAPHSAIAVRSYYSVGVLLCRYSFRGDTVTATIGRRLGKGEAVRRLRRPQQHQRSPRTDDRVEEEIWEGDAVGSHARARPNSGGEH
jgi:hypothetical protein